MRIIGIDGIFYDDASPAYGVDKSRLEEALRLIDNNQLSVIINTDNIEWILSTGKVKPSHGILIEPFMYREGMKHYPNPDVSDWIKNHGIEFYGGSYNRIGGISSDSSNVISGNDRCGIYIVSYASGTEHESICANNIILGNYIGTNISGTQSLGNSEQGIATGRNLNTIIGGAEIGARNIISGNGLDGISIYGALGENNKIIGNYIGVAANGLDSFLV